MTDQNALVVALQQLADDLGHPPTSRDMRDHGEFTVGAYRSAFGSWSNALEAAGFDSNRSGTTYDEGDLLQELRRLADELGHTPTIEELREHGRYSITPYKNHFGSWSNGLEKAGFENARSKPVPPEEALDELQRIADELGHVPSKGEFQEHGQFSADVFRNHFGSWSEGVAAAGLDPEKARQQISDGELLGDLRRLSEDFENPPIQQIVREHGEYSPETYRDRFGSWQEALEAAGLDHEPSRLSEAELLEELRRIAEELGHAPSDQEFTKHGKHSTTTYYERFGSWRKALQAAGLEDRPPQRAIPREDLLAELKHLSDELDAVPSRTEMNEQGAYHSDTYVRRFGSWDAALEAAGIVCEEPE